jgi:hypothetical protein
VPEPDRSKVIKVIHEWLESHSLPRLDITNVKTLDMIELWDDRAVQVAFNTGDRAGCCWKPDCQIFSPRFKRRTCPENCVVLSEKFQRATVVLAPFDESVLGMSSMPYTWNKECF